MLRPASDLANLVAGRGWPHADTADALRLPGAMLVVVDGEVVGDCGWYGPPGDTGEVEIGYGLSPAYRGRGLGTAMVAALVAWVAEQPGVRRIVAETEVTNVASRRVLERNGFTVESVAGAAVRYMLPASNMRA